MQFIRGRGRRACDSISFISIQKDWQYNVSNVWLCLRSWSKETEWKPFLTCPCLYVVTHWFWIPLHPDPNHYKGKCVCPSEASNTKRWNHITIHPKDEREDVLVLLCLSCLWIRFYQGKWQLLPTMSPTSALLLFPFKLAKLKPKAVKWI